MPKKVINDYVFYKIICLDNSVELCYVGSTANFIKRRSSHKNTCNNENNKNYNLKIYKTIREYGGWSNFKMIQIGTREQLTLRQAEQIEEEYRIELNANMNGRRCYITEEQKPKRKKEIDKEYRENNKEKIKEYYENNKENNKEKIKEYRENNKEKMNEYQKNYRENNKEQTREYNKKYRENNRDKKKELDRKYRENNKEQIKEKALEKKKKMNEENNDNKTT